jgi:NagD protein
LCYSVVAGVNSQIDPVLVLSGVTKIQNLREFPYRPYVVLGGVYEIPSDAKENIVSEEDMEEASRRLSII